MWLTNGKETLELTHPVQIAAFKNSGYKECKAPKKRADKAPEEPVKEEPVKEESAKEESAKDEAEA